MDNLNRIAVNNIRAEMARRGLTQEQFAGRLEWNRSNLATLLTGGTQITLNKLEQIAAALELPPSKLLAND